MDCTRGEVRPSLRRPAPPAAGYGASVVPFTFEGAAVRVITRDGEPWFVAADVARVLEIGRTDDAVRRLDEDERGADTVRTPGGDQKVTIINESGLFSLVLTSRKEAAKRFKKWVTSEVIPSIRRTGSYALPPAQAARPMTRPIYARCSSARPKE